MQRALIQYRNPKNYYLVREALEKANRQDLIGFDKKCLIRPYAPGHQPPYGTAWGAKNAGKPARKGDGPAKGSKPRGGKPTRESGKSAAPGAKPSKPGKRPAGWAKPKAAKTSKPNSRRGK